MHERNQNVQRVSQKSISYSPTFKVGAVKAYNDGQTPMKIFLHSGFNLSRIGEDTPKNAWSVGAMFIRNTGNAGLTEERRGKGCWKRKVTSLKSDALERRPYAYTRIHKTNLPNGDSSIAPFSCFCAQKKPGMK
jgi:hypothetical protein